MTNKEFLTKVIEMGVDDVMKSKAEEMLNALEKKNASRAKESEKNRAENLEKLEVLLNVMEEGRTYGVSEFAEFDLGLSNSKVTAILKLGAEVGKVGVVENFKVGGKGRNVKGYYKC